MAYENILAQIASPKPSNYLASYLGGVEARSALDEQQRQGQARQLAGRALTGDKAAGQQLAQVDPQVFMELRKFQGDERAKELERVGGLYYSADTPEKWAVAINFLKKAGYEVSPEDEDFRNRDALLGMAMTAAQRIALEHQNRQFGLQERQFAADQDYRAQSLDLERQRLAQTAGKDSLLAKMQERATAAQTMGLDPKSAEFRNFVLTGAQSSLGRGNASLTATDRKAILEADDTVLANEGVISALDRAITINNKAYSGIGASVRPILDRNLPDFIPGINEAKGTATTEFQNLVLGQALASLKSTFGAAPTEGERQILLDLQASVDKSPAWSAPRFWRSVALI